MKKDLDKPIDNAPHAPGAGSDKQHADTPEDANERFNRQKKGNIQENPDKQNTG